MSLNPYWPTCKHRADFHASDATAAAWLQHLTFTPLLRASPTGYYRP
jgi:hypothetical protein